MMSLKRFVFLATACAALCLSPLSAHADNFTLTYTNTTGTVPGSFTVEILGLTNNTVSAASQVLITAFPAGLNSALGSAPIDATTWDSEMVNIFDEVNGELTEAAFYATDTVNSVPAGAELFIDDTQAFLQLDGLGLGTPGSAIVLDQTVSSATTPEPSGLILLATGLAGAAGVMRRKMRA